MRNLIGVLIVALSGLPATAPAAGQDGDGSVDWRPAFGDRSIAFSLPESGSSRLALWWHRSGHGATGLELEVSGGLLLAVGGADPARLGSHAGVSIGPAFKRYRGSLGPVAPYSITGFGLSGALIYQAVDDPGTDPVSRWEAGTYVRMGGGVDWFVAERVSIGGHVGGRVSYRVIFPRDSTDATRHNVNLGTFTSGLTLHIYF